MDIFIVIPNDLDDVKEVILFNMIEHFEIRDDLGIPPQALTKHQKN